MQGKPTLCVPDRVYSLRPYSNASKPIDVDELTVNIPADPVKIESPPPSPSPPGTPYQPSASALSAKAKRKLNNHEQRKMNLNQDEQVQSYDDQYIWCKYCGRKIGTGGTLNLGPWNSHRIACKAPT
jgi:hypothetical protein